MTIAPLSKHNTSLPNVPVSEIETYLSSIVHRCNVPIASTNDSNNQDVTPEEIFRVLTKREYCYLSKSKASRYKDEILARLTESLSGGDVLPFYYDIGGGYHASICPGNDNLVFRAELAELFILSQVSGFCSDVAQLYAPGARFILVVDNLCAALVNDIPVASTLGFCASLRQMIDELGLNDHVNLLVESEQFALSEYESRLQAKVDCRSSFVAEPSAQEIENVSRFLGRPCDKAEAIQRIQRYKDVTEISEASLNSVIRGVRMTQRASDTTIGFRPFPGGDSRVQAGEVALSKNSKGKVHPFLLTSRNARTYVCQQLAATRVLPSTVDHITYAEKIGN